MESLKLASERLTRTSRILRDRSEDGLEDGSSNLVGKLVEVPEAFWSYLDLVGHSDMILQLHAFARCGFTPRAADRLEKFLVLKDVDGLIECFEFVWADENGSGPPLASDVDALALSQDAIHEFGKVRLRFGERNRLSHNRSEF